MFASGFRNWLLFKILKLVLLFYLLNNNHDQFFPLSFIISYKGYTLVHSTLRKIYNKKDFPRNIIFLPKCRRNRFSLFTLLCVLFFPHLSYDSPFRLSFRAARIYSPFPRAFGLFIDSDIPCFCKPRWECLYASTRFLLLSVSLYSFVYFFL